MPLAVVAENVARELTAEAEERTIRIKLRARATPTVLGDPAELFRALASLVDNGIQNAPRGTTVLLQIDVAGSRALVDILDEGAGVPLPLRQVVFQPFHGSAPDSGCLPLTTARSIVHGHGGEIAFVECGYGHVHVELPCAAPAAWPEHN